MNAESGIDGVSDAAQQKVAEDLLSTALSEAQQSIRSYDTKAQICAIGYLFSLNIILGINETLFPDAGASIWVVLVGWGVLILPMLFFGYVLHPTRHSVRQDEREETADIKKILYLRHERHKTVTQIKQSALGANKLDELAFELLKSSTLRDHKRLRFVRALVLAVSAFFMMFLIHILEAVSRFF
jgi:hypothetical protein